MNEMIFIYQLHSWERKIGRESGVLPPSLYITVGLTIIDSHPYAGGGCADVYRGHLNGGMVALKSARDLTLNDKEREVLRRVRFLRGRNHISSYDSTIRIFASKRFCGANHHTLTF